MSVGRRRAPSERGAAAVEFALVVPLLLLLIFGIISYGMMLSFRQGLTQAASEGARAAAVTLVEANRKSAAASAIDQVMSSYSVSCQLATGKLVKGSTNVGTCVVTDPAKCDPAQSGADPKCVSVTLTYDYRANSAFVFPGSGVVVPQQLTYTASVRVS